ncbi:succinate dehydrogenase cytochrome b556 subunit [Vibrio gallicus]|uniref:succinate dehydrogenase cytochrome b556 subunit n=1 Tax=Vibrio gallicus TaxID=190897 RepID=UPI0036F42F5A
MTKKNQRPINLDLQTIQFPITAIASILHRISGVITFVFVGVLLWLLSTSLSSPKGFMEAANFIDGWFVKFILWGMLSALFYHIVGGIRHLCQDLGYFEDLESGTKSAQVSFIITGVLALLAGVIVW